MRDVLEDVERWHAAGERIALATVVSVKGSAPRGIGATLAVNQRGEISGSVSGGCVEPAVIEESLRSIRTGVPTLLSYGITEEQNVERIGLSCGGEIRVFVERLDTSPTLDAVVRGLRLERPLVEATVIAASAPHQDLLGRKWLFIDEARGVQLVTPEGHTELDQFVRQDAPGMLATGASATHVYHLSADPAETVEVFYAVQPAPPTLIIIGAGHISIPLTVLAKQLDYRVIVVDAREAFATRDRLPAADEILVEWPDEALARLPISSATAIAVLTHDDKFDVPALVAALRSPAGYVGAIGSRGTRQRRDERLREAGLTDEQIARIYGPIGLDIGAATPAEIALAILAQIIAVRRGREQKPSNAA